MDAASAPPPARRSNPLRRPQVATLLMLIVVLAGFTIAAPHFASPRNVSNMLAFMPELGIIALGMCLLLTAGEFDLSVGAVFALGACVAMILVQSTGWAIGPSLAAGLLTCMLVGLVNGLIVTKMGISSFLVTLSMLLVVRGSSLYLTQGFPLQSYREETVFRTLLAGDFNLGPFRLYASLFWFAGLALLAGYVLTLSRLGNWISAIGSNRQAAIARGVPADAVKIGLFVLTSTLAGLAGMISAFRINNASPVAGTEYELEVIAMVVVGGTALTGGYGTIFGTVLGVILLRAIRNGIIMIGVPGLAYSTFVGGIILLMLMLHAGLRRAGEPGR
ncbi:ABC transporter permease [Roseisalinus antarcticus]|nr:ABC transporter permease [Roseisalinus antarcticus]